MSLTADIPVFRLARQWEQQEGPAGGRQGPQEAAEQPVRPGAQGFGAAPPRQGGRVPDSLGESATRSALRGFHPSGHEYLLQGDTSA